MSAPEPSRTLTYALTTLCLVVAAPVFWRAVERPHEPGGPRGANEPLFTQTLPTLHDAFDGGEETPGSRRIAYQPLNLVFRLVRPAERAMAWHAALCLAVAGTGLAWSLLSLGTRGAAALLGGAVYAFGGTAAGAMSRVELACVLAWAPWVLWAAARAARGTRHTRYAVLTGVFAGFALLSGAHLHALPALLPAAGLALAARTGTEEEPPLTRRILLLVLATAIGASLSAASWVPVLLADAARDVPGLAIAGAPRVPNLVSAGADDLPRAGYMGIAPLLLLPAAFAGRNAARAALYLGVMLAVSWVGALYLAKPDGWLLAAAMCGAALAGLGAEALFAPARDWRSPRVVLPVLAAGTLCLVVLLLGDAGAVGRLPFATAPIVLAIALRTPRATTVAALVLTAFIMADLAAASRNRFPHPYFDYAGNAPAISRPQETGGQEIQNAPGAEWPGAESADAPRN